MYLKKKLISIFFIGSISLLFLFIVAGNASDLQELRVAFGMEIVTFDMHNYLSSMDVIAAQPIFETLVDTDKDNNIVPKLATSWKQVDPLSWEFKLREGVKFHDGTDFTAKDVKFSIERCSVGGGAAYAEFVKEVEIVDDYTVIMHLHREYVPILECFAVEIPVITNQKFVEEKGDAIGQYANGTGPFILEEFTPGVRTVFVKNQNYWGNPAKLDRIEIRAIPEDGTRIMALRSGEVDLIENPAPTDIPFLERDDNFYVYSSLKNRTLFIGFNLKDETIGQNKAIREAIEYAIDRKILVDVVLEGLGEVADTGFIPQSVSRGFSDPYIAREFNIEKAKAILKDAGIEEGKEIEFTVTRGRYLKDTEIAEVIQEQLRKVGLTARIEIMEFAPFVSYVQGLQGQMFQQAWGWANGEAFAVLYALFNSNGPRNRFAFYNEEFDTLLDKAVATVDYEERMKIYNQAYRIIYDQVAIVPLLHYKNVYAANKKVKGLFVEPGENIKFEEIYIEQ